MACAVHKKDGEHGIMAQCGPIILAFFVCIYPNAMRPLLWNNKIQTLSNGQERQCKERVNGRKGEAKNRQNSQERGKTRKEWESEKKAAREGGVQENMPERIAGAT